MDESPSEEPPQRTSASGVIQWIDPDAMLAEAVRVWLDDASRKVETHLGLVGEVRVRLLGDEEMARAHERYKGRSGPTDVLTFDLEPDSDVLDVDVLVCVDEASRRAAQFGHDVAREILLYMVHGVLHCLGYDDHDPEQAERMHREEDRLLEAIGVGAVFAPAGAVDREGAR